MKFRNTGDEYKTEQQHFIIGHFEIGYCWLETKLHLSALIVPSLTFRKEESKDGARVN